MAASNIVDVVGQRTSLRKSSGTRYMGRCPFHDERSPSFSVNSDLNVYYCFGCGKGGDVVTFVRETEGLDFVGAIEWLAERFRVRSNTKRARPWQTSRAGGESASSPSSTRRLRSSSVISGRDPTASRFAGTSRAGARREDLEGVSARSLARHGSRAEGA